MTKTEKLSQKGLQSIDKALETVLTVKALLARSSVESKIPISFRLVFGEHQNEVISNYLLLS